MKTQYKNKSSKGFTLIELLVVIAIIAVLAAAGFAGGNIAMEKARKVATQAGAISITTAVEQFYAEYSALPDANSSGSSSDVELDSTGDGVVILEILAAIESGSDDTIQNPRNIRFLTTKEGKNSKDGIIYNSSGDAIEAMYDSWGQPFFIMMDYDYDERLSVSPQGSTNVNLNGKRVAVYSLGVGEPADADASTLVKSW
ncbi:MAG: prepilin-type N-terminal cleavage/methylation domain-containing protein [Luteolibacter sp.]